MIEQATLQVAGDGGVLIILPKTGMDPNDETDVCIRDLKLFVGQKGKWFVEASIVGPTDADYVIGNQDLSVVEVDEDEILIHQRVKERSP